MPGTTILAIDPSSSCCGFAFGHATGMGASINFAGRFLPTTRKTAMDRIMQMCAHFRLLILEHGPNDIVIEAPSGKIHGRYANTKIPTLAIYGMAVGAIWATCKYALRENDGRIHLIDANEWTAGKGKQTRKLRAKALWNPYLPEKDTGGDISDAICLLDWFCRDRELARLKKA